jgi:hypothetical protein
MRYAADERPQIVDPRQPSGRVMMLGSTARSVPSVAPGPSGSRTVSAGPPLSPRRRSSSAASPQASLTSPASLELPALSWQFGLPASPGPPVSSVSRTSKVSPPALSAVQSARGRGVLGRGDPLTACTAARIAAGTGGRPGCCVLAATAAGIAREAWISARAARADPTVPVDRWVMPVLLAVRTLCPAARPWRRTRHRAARRVPDAGCCRAC